AGFVNYDFSEVSSFGIFLSWRLIRLFIGNFIHGKETGAFNLSKGAFLTFPGNGIAKKNIILVFLMVVAKLKISIQTLIHPWMISFIASYNRIKPIMSHFVRNGNVQVFFIGIWFGDECDHGVLHPAGT